MRRSVSPPGGLCQWRRLAGFARFAAQLLARAVGILALAARLLPLAAGLFARAVGFLALAAPDVALGLCLCARGGGGVALRLQALRALLLALALLDLPGAVGFLALAAIDVALAAHLLPLAADLVALTAPFEALAAGLRGDRDQKQGGAEDNPAKTRTEPRRERPEAGHHRFSFRVSDGRHELPIHRRVRQSPRWPRLQTLALLPMVTGTAITMQDEARCSLVCGSRCAATSVHRGVGCAEDGRSIRQRAPAAADRTSLAPAGNDRGRCSTWPIRWSAGSFGLRSEPHMVALSDADGSSCASWRHSTTGRPATSSRALPERARHRHQRIAGRARAGAGLRSPALRRDYGGWTCIGVPVCSRTAACWARWICRSATSA
jgi:hypothetical protein